MKIHLVWPLAVAAEEPVFVRVRTWISDPAFHRTGKRWDKRRHMSALEMQVIARDEWASGWRISARTDGRHEISFEVKHLRELLDRIGSIKRVFAVFGITPEIEVDGRPLLEFAWRKQVEEIHYLGLLDWVTRMLRPRATDAGNATIRVALRNELNKPFAEIEAALIAEVEGVLGRSPTTRSHAAG